RNARRATRPTGPSWRPRSPRCRTTTSPTPRASSTWPRRTCATIGNGGTCAAGSTTALPWSGCPPGPQTPPSSAPPIRPRPAAPPRAGPGDVPRPGAGAPAGWRPAAREGGAPRPPPPGPERPRWVRATQPRRGLRVAAWVGNTTFDLLDEAGRVLCRVEEPG